MHSNLQKMKMVIRITVTVCFLLLFLKYPSEVFPHRVNAFVPPMKGVGLLWWEIEENMKDDEMPGNWKDIRKARLKQQIIRGKAKSLFLCWGDISSRDAPRRYKAGLERKIMLGKVVIWVRDANGRISQASFNPAKEKLSVSIPEDLELNGLYLVGAHLDAGEMDIDSDGETERVHLTAKRIVSHSKTGGRQGNKRGVFFNDPNKFPLEIGCSDFWFRHDYQRAYREYEMKVVYRGKPLANTEVLILSRSGWRKIIHTDTNGKFLITPFGETENDGQGEYLYVTCYQDLLKREYHCATLMMNVCTNPEWRSKSSGFMLWTIVGTGLLVIIIVSGIYRKKKHNRETIVKFENLRIKKV